MFFLQKIFKIYIHQKSQYFIVIVSKMRVLRQKRGWGRLTQPPPAPACRGIIVKKKQNWNCMPPLYLRCYQVLFYDSGRLGRTYLVVYIYQTMKYIVNVKVYTPHTLSIHAQRRLYLYSILRA